MRLRCFCDVISSAVRLWVRHVAAVVSCPCFIIVAAAAGFPVTFMSFFRHLVLAFKSRDLSSVHVMASVGKRCCCVYAIYSK